MRITGFDGIMSSVAITGILLATTVHAGHIHGNGGDVLVCGDVATGAATYELLDFFEAKTMRNLTIDIGSSTLDVPTMVEIALKRLHRFDPERTTMYRSWASTFMNEANFLSNTTLTDIDDSGYVVHSDDCVVKQIAIQMTPMTVLDKRYLIDAKLWSRLDNTNKAGLILHEIIYRDALERGQENSIGVRFFTGLLASTYIEGVDAAIYESLMTNSGMLDYRAEFVIDGKQALYRFFDKIKLGDGSKAVAFCKGLPGLSSMEKCDDAAILLPTDNAIFNKIRVLPATPFWCDIQPRPNSGAFIKVYWESVERIVDAWPTSNGAGTLCRTVGK